MSIEEQYQHCLKVAAGFYVRHDYTAAFATVAEALRVDPFHLKAQTIAVASLTKLEAGVLERFVATWAAASRFGTLENATAILSETFFECDDTYDLFAGLAILSLRLEQSEMALRMFALCLTDGLPPPAAADEVVAEYDAELYDSQTTHRDSVAEFDRFLSRHLDPAGTWDIIDAPCGTGLAGSILKPRAKRLMGIDLVPAMVSRAESLGCYDEVVTGDLLEVLPCLKAEMIVCHGALYYFPDITPIVAAVTASLASGGYFAFTDFPAPDGVMATRGGNARYCRNPALVRSIMAAHGFSEMASDLRLSFTLPCLYWLFRKG